MQKTKSKRESRINTKKKSPFEVGQGDVPRRKPILPLWKWPGGCF